MLGDHWIKSWSNTQAIIALSSGEAEYYGIVKAGSVGLGMKAMLGDLGLNRKLRVLTDSSAAKGIASRKGVGNARYLEVSQVWLQGRVASGVIELTKVNGKLNFAAALTKHVGREGICAHMFHAQQWRQG